MTNSEISFYTDTLLVETLLADPNGKLYKQAGIIDDLLGRVKEYFMTKVDPENPVTSVLNMLAPGALWMIFQSLGLGKWGMIAGFLVDTLHIDVGNMMTSLWNKTKELLSEGKQLSSAQIDQAAQEAAQVGDSGAQVHYSSLELLHDAKMVSLALIDYEHQILRLSEEPVKPIIALAAGKGSSMFAKILSWVFKIALASAGLMVAGDVANKIVGRPSSLSGTYQYQAGKPVDSSTPAVAAPPMSTQKVFPNKGDAPLPSMLPVENTPENIEAQLIQFTKDVYSGLDGKENLIRQSPAFQAVKEEVVWSNESHPGSMGVFIPKMFTSKKQMADYFIDDVAKMAPQPAKPGAYTNI